VCSRAQTPAADPAKWWHEAWNTIRQFWMPNHDTTKTVFDSLEIRCRRRTSWHRKWQSRVWGTERALFVSFKMTKVSFSHTIARWMDMLQTRHVMGTAQSRYISISTEKSGWKSIRTLLTLLFFYRVFSYRDDLWGEYGPAADIWAFGCLMLQMMQLSLPHGEDLSGNLI
jgi:hypothetical protein